MSTSSTPRAKLRTGRAGVVPADEGHASPVARPHRIDGPAADGHVAKPQPSHPLGSWWRRGLHGGLAAMFVSLGVAGAVLPGLPATPFLLLASFFLARSSPRLNERLHRSWFIGQILQDWEQQRGVRQSVKVQAVGTIVLCVGATIAFSSLSGAMLGVIAAAAGVGVLIVLRLPSAQK